MAFKRVSQTALPPRRWALKGYYGDGKSTFILAMQQPTLMIDADGRRHELKGGELYELSEEAADHRSVERIQDLLDAHMPGSDIRTIAIDSVTSLIGVSIARAMLDNAADRNRNKNQAWVDKAEKMRLLQDAVTAHGSHVLWIWHLEDAQLNGKAQIRETLPETERERLYRSLNAALRIVREDGRRGVLVEWSREGPSGMIVWDDEGHWKGVPERIEAAIYGHDGGIRPTAGAAGPAATVPATTMSVGAPAARRGGSSWEATADAAATGTSDGVLTFYGPAEAVAWGVGQGAFPTAEAAQEAYDRLKADAKPRNAREMYAAWIDLVHEPQRRRA
ncbi:AAA family ATPase [Azospirillum sp. YIM B02556]|uniref:AAA family ATPase n=1 Tax=Azospirillum endophyticum TaxID=2800326 RepID=A0ABS1F0E3_9PROT|nr:AAA family ATPase [Azospirillum endophyticum]MBK1836888.1 AAA family ATPase [Azospirillum endophyticum]